MVLRFWNDDVRSNIERVMDKIVHVLESTPTPAPPRKGRGNDGAAYAEREGEAERVGEGVWVPRVD